MNKRKAFDLTTTEELAKDLKASTGAGMDAFFPSHQIPVSPTPQVEIAKVEVEQEQRKKEPVAKFSMNAGGRTSERPNGRTKIRHSFDIYRDQLDALSDIQYRTAKMGKKPLLGQLVQEALDSYITKANGRTSERMSAD